MIDASALLSVDPAILSARAPVRAPAGGDFATMLATETRAIATPLPPLALAVTPQLPPQPGTIVLPAEPATELAPSESAAVPPILAMLAPIEAAPPAAPVSAPALPARATSAPQPEAAPTALPAAPAPTPWAREILLPTVARPAPAAAALFPQPATPPLSRPAPPAPSPRAREVPASPAIATTGAIEPIEPGAPAFVPAAEPVLFAAPQATVAAPTTAAAQPAPVLDLTDPRALETLAREIAATADAAGRLSFRLAPETLGMLDIGIADTRDGLALSFEVESETARGALLAAEPRLVAEARAQGLRIADTQVALAGHGQGQPGGHRAPAEPPAHPQAGRSDTNDDRPTDARTRASARYA